ncbi:hypothetical protein B6E66_29800 [Streptomyces maremycinicus]|nr:hypothetical protein B6E66_29800 [Streptomyces sp. B9173]
MGPAPAPARAPAPAAAPWVPGVPTAPPAPGDSGVPGRSSSSSPLIVRPPWQRSARCPVPVAPPPSPGRAGG